MSAHTAIIAMLKGQIAIAVFPAVLFFLVIIGVMLNQVIGEIAAIAVLVRVVIVVRKELRQLHDLFCKRIICQKLKQEKYGREFFQQSNIGNFGESKLNADDADGYDQIRFRTDYYCRFFIGSLRVLAPLREYSPMISFCSLI